MSKWIEKRTRPVLPLYLAALTWPVASLILPPYRLVNLVIIAALSTVVYLVSSRFCPTRVQRVEQPYATGSENTDAMLNGIAANLDALHKLNEAIPDPQLSGPWTAWRRQAAALPPLWRKPPTRRAAWTALPATTCPRSSS